MNKSILAVTALSAGAMASGACPSGYKMATGDNKQSFPGFGSINGKGGPTSNISTAQECAALCNSEKFCGSFEYSTTVKRCELNYSRVGTEEKEGDFYLCTRKLEMTVLDPPVFPLENTKRLFSSVWAPAPGHPHHDQWHLDNMQGRMADNFGWWTSAYEELRDGPHWQVIDARVNGNPRMICGVEIAGRNNKDEYDYWNTKAKFSFSMSNKASTDMATITNWTPIAPIGGGAADNVFENVLDETNFKHGRRIEFPQCVEANFFKWDLIDSVIRPGGRIALLVASPDVTPIEIDNGDGTGVPSVPYKLESQNAACGSDKTIQTVEQCRLALEYLNKDELTGGFYKGAEPFEITEAGLPSGCLVSNTPKGSYPETKEIKFNTAGTGACNGNAADGAANCICRSEKNVLQRHLNQHLNQETTPEADKNLGFCFRQDKLMVVKEGINSAVECQTACQQDPYCGFITYNSETEENIRPERNGKPAEPRCLLFHTEQCNMSSNKNDRVKMMKQEGEQWIRLRGHKIHETSHTWKKPFQTDASETDKASLPFTHEGCFESGKKGDRTHRVLPFIASGFRGKKYRHRMMCAKLCSGYSYFGMQKNACYCGMEKTANKNGELNKVDNSQCDYKCKGDDKHTCGGKRLMDVYKYKSDSTGRQLSSPSNTVAASSMISVKTLAASAEKRMLSGAAAEKRNLDVVDEDLELEHPEDKDDAIDSEDLDDAEEEVSMEEKELDEFSTSNAEAALEKKDAGRVLKGETVPAKKGNLRGSKRG